MTRIHIRFSSWLLALLLVVAAGVQAQPVYAQVQDARHYVIQPIHNKALDTGQDKTYNTLAKGKAGLGRVFGRHAKASVKAR